MNGSAEPTGSHMAFRAVAWPDTIVTGGVMIKAHVHGPLGHVRLTEPVSPSSVVMLTDAEMPAFATMSSKSRSRLAPTVTVFPTVKLDPWVAVQPNCGESILLFLCTGEIKMSRERDSFLA